MPAVDVKEEFLPFSRPTITDDEIQEVVACLTSGWLATGPRVQKFEEALQQYLSAPHVFSLTSGTAGLYLALKALDLEPGDEIITTPLTFVATLNTIELAGGKPVLVDVDPKTYNIDVNKITAAITKRTRAIIPVHFAGLSVDLDPLYALAQEHKLVVIEDAAHAIGTAYKGKRIGSFGDIQIFSFHPNKNITTIEGGAISTHDESLTKKLSTGRFHGIDRSVWDRFSKKGSQAYDVIEPALKFNLSDVQASMGIHQLKRLPEFIEKRTHLANRYLDTLKGWDEIYLPPHAMPFENTHAWHLFAPCLNIEKIGMNRNDFMQAMKDLGIGLGLHYEACHLYHYYKETYGYNEGDFPHAERIGNRIFSLPLFPLLTEHEQDRAIQAMAKIFGRSI